jgi:hypothetical protein
LPPDEIDRARVEAILDVVKAAANYPGCAAVGAGRTENQQAQQILHWLYFRWAYGFSVCQHRHPWQRGNNLD